MNDRLNDEITTDEINERLNKVISALKKDPAFHDRESAYLIGAIAYIEKTAPNPKKSVSDCHYPSIVQAIINSMELKIPIDNRNLAHLESKYDKNLGKKVCKLGIGYRAYFYKLSQTLNDFDGEAFCVYEGDEITTEDINGFHSYKLNKKDLFVSGIDKIKGVIVRLSYTINGENRQKLGIIGIDEILKIKSKAKTQMIWNEWFDEKAKAAAIRRACKGLFDISQGLQELVEYDNKDFNLDKQKEINIMETIDNAISSKIYITEDQVNEIRSAIYENESDEDMILDFIGAKAIEEIKADDYEMALEAINGK